MQLGNAITLEKPQDTSSRLFHISTPKIFRECMNVLYYLAIERKGIYVQILSKDKFKMAQVRALYWIWIKEQFSSSQHDGTSIKDMHKQYKATHLLSILCAKDQDFADMVIAFKDDEVKLDMLLSIADSSITGYSEMSQYFDECKEKETYI